MSEWAGCWVLQSEGGGAGSTAVISEEELEAGLRLADANGDANEMLEEELEEKSLFQLTRRPINMLNSCRKVDCFERLNRISEGTYGVVYRYCSLFYTNHVSVCHRYMLFLELCHCTSLQHASHAACLCTCTRPHHSMGEWHIKLLCGYLEAHCTSRRRTAVQL